MARLGDLTNIKTGKLDANASSPDGQYPFFTCSKETLRIASYQYDCECVLVAGNGDLNVKYYNGKFDAYQRTYIIESKDKTVLLVPYLYYFLDAYVEILREQSIGGVIKYIKLGNLTEAKIPLPDLSIQRKIIDQVSRLEQLISLRKQQLAKLDELVKARFVEMFGDEKQFTYMPLSESVEEMFIGPFGSSLKNDCFVSKEDAFCMVYEQKHAIRKTMDVGTRYVCQKKYNELKRFTVMGGDIIVSCRGTIGEIYILPDNAPLGIMHPSIMKIRLKESVYNKNYFVFALEQSMKKHNDEANGSGVKMAVTATTLGKERFAIPPMPSQQQFANFVVRTNRQKLTIQQSLDKLEVLRKSLMQEYFG